MFQLEKSSNIYPKFSLPEQETTFMSSVQLISIRKQAFNLNLKLIDE